MLEQHHYQGKKEQAFCTGFYFNLVTEPLNCCDLGIKNFEYSGHIGHLDYAIHFGNLIENIRLIIDEDETERDQRNYVQKEP